MFLIFAKCCYRNIRLFITNYHAQHCGNQTLSPCAAITYTPQNTINQMAHTDTKKTKPEYKENKLFIGNLDPRVTEYHIINLFHPF